MIAANEGLAILEQAFEDTMNDQEICQFMGNNRITYVQHYGTNVRESGLIAAAERVLAGVAF